MKTQRLKNPFPLSAYYGQEYFCDREEETKMLIRNIENGLSTTLIAIRRIGKTGLIQHCLQQLPSNWKSIYIDILDTENLNYFLNKLATSILQIESQSSSKGKKIWDFIGSLRPTISFDSLTGAPSASFNLQQKEVELTIENALSFLEIQEYKTVIAIDEFQQILTYPEQNTDAWLRSRVQTLKNVVFIFSGSQQHLMNELFTSPKRPFYRSTQSLPLSKIPQNIYRDFIIEKFKSYKKTISEQCAEEILEWSNCHTFYVQQICNRVFSASNTHINSALWKEQAVRLLKEQELMFFSYRNMLTKAQWNLLKAIGQEKLVFQPNSSTFLQQYSLGSSATVLRSLKSLLKTELVYTDFTPDGKKFYAVYDVLFENWIDGRY